MNNIKICISAYIISAESVEIWEKYRYDINNLFTNE